MNVIQRFTFLIIALQLVTACNSDSALECFRTAGDAVQYDIAVADFNAIHISAGIELVIKEGTEQRVTVHTGENLKEYITAEVIEGELFITNSNNCNWTRDYNSTTVYVTTPHLEKIYSASQFAVKSDGVLTFPSLAIQSGLFSETASGTFELEVNTEYLLIEDDQFSYYEISGAVNELFVKFYNGDSRFEGSGLIAQKAEVFQRSSNDIIINPQQEVKGTIYSTGNLVLKNEPPVVVVEQLYSGHIVYQ
ncbi:DUF2807 domain-containing protein [Flavobacterium salilacus subsp. salilacus]|uniref:head GIN domain-containing protein n=1 Tax=Flavobacterium TaxID=237 RepID=UPI001074B55F|nr:MULTISPECIES: head GIN domain-containing protein [Flavobacterium]KAF2519916.1 DUF2807 domain-containing protein [Flavobacterium salilacus subsp. salilacus]MBE1614174.1 DUF2807 domain-containing protein [Flavobacterium sp. SaA2.13]